MSKKNKYCFLGVFFAIILNLVACDPNRYYFNYEDLKNSVAKVELISYNNNEARIIKNKKKLLRFDFNKVYIIETLREESLDEFLMDLSKTLIFQYLKHSDSPVGICLRIIYNNNDFEIISCTLENGILYDYVGSFDSNGDVKNFIGGVSGKTILQNLINKYFFTKI